MRLVCFLILAACSSTTFACWQEAGARYGIQPALLYGVARVESSLNPVAVNRSHYDQTGSYDIGLMQVNSRSLPALKKFGISERDLYDPCTSIYVGAWILRQKLNQYPGHPWQAVGAYNASCTRLKGEQCLRARSIYSWKVYRAMMPLFREATR
jgi:Soluble lytic murein transglycosylase and related regulatory proteins (some contain LysM/invasin domains)